MSKPKLFIGSSSENLRAAEVLGDELEHCATVTIWNEGVFNLNQGTLETLLSKADDFDFAVLVWAEDDVTLSKGESKPSTRDNVLFECGLFMGRLGRDRVFIVYDESIELKIPSDLAGITLASYDGSRIDGSDAAAAVRKACRLISDAIKKPMFSHIVGEWRSKYPLTSEVGYPLDEEDIEIKPAKGGICMIRSSNTQDDNIIAQGNLVEGKYLMGHWQDITTGVFLLMLNSRCNLMYGYYIGPDDSFGPRYANWVLAKKDGVEEDEIRERLERGFKLLRDTVGGAL